jgi:hypothetical protein
VLVDIWRPEHNAGAFPAPIASLWLHRVRAACLQLHGNWQLVCQDALHSVCTDGSTSDELSGDGCLCVCNEEGSRVIESAAAFVTVQAGGWSGGCPANAANAYLSARSCSDVVGAGAENWCAPTCCCSYVKFAGLANVGDFCRCDLRLNQNKSAFI